MKAVVGVFEEVATRVAPCKNKKIGRMFPNDTTTRTVAKKGDDTRFVTVYLRLASTAQKRRQWIDAIVSLHRANRLTDAVLLGAFLNLKLESPSQALELVRKRCPPPATTLETILLAHGDAPSTSPFPNLK